MTAELVDELVLASRLTMMREWRPDLAGKDALAPTYPSVARLAVPSSVFAAGGAVYAVVGDD